MLTEIKKIGFEVEGEMSYDTQEKVQDWGAVGSDGSIRTCSNHAAKYNEHNMSAVEFRSVPFEIKKLETAKGPMGFFDMLSEQHKNGEYHYNDSMGFHIHVSFNTPYKPPELFSEEFCEFFTTRLAKAFPAMYEKRKTNRYCNATWNVDEIVSPNDRYRAINYAAYSEHSTIEFRIFGATDPQTMWDELNFTIDTINEFLKQPISRKWKIKLRNSYTKKTNVVARTSEEVIQLPPVIIGREYVETLPDMVIDGKKINRYL